jgi:hypothetical protein
MSEKIYVRLLRFYPSRFRKEYEAEALQLIRDRLRDETGFFKRVRLWWDLVTDVLAGLPCAYRNSYPVAEAASLSLNAAGIPSFKSLDKEPLGLGSILVGSTISLIALAVFAFLLSRPVTYQPISGSNGRMSPIESVMRRLNSPPPPDSAESSLQDATTPPSAQMSGPPAQPSTPGASTPNTSASETGIPSSERNPGPIGDVRDSSHDSQSVIPQSARYSGMIAKRTPTVALSCMPANPAPGSMVNLSATVLAVGTGPIPTGNVRFFDGSAVLNMGRLNNGTVTVEGKLPYIATHSLSVVYYGDANYGSASSIGARQ